MSDVHEAPDWRHYCQGVDGKVYPRRGLTRVLGWDVIGRAHYLRHHDGMSVRRIAATVADDFGLQRRPAVGTVHAWLATPCGECSGAAIPTPEHLRGGGADE